MAYQVEVVGAKYYSRIGGVAQEVPVGTKLVLRHKPSDRENKLKLIKEVDDGQLVINDNPEAARLRDEGKPQAADKAMAADKEQKAAAKAEPAAAKAEPGLPKPDAK